MRQWCVTLCNHNLPGQSPAMDNSSAYEWRSLSAGNLPQLRRHGSGVVHQVQRAGACYVLI